MNNSSKKNKNYFFSDFLKQQFLFFTLFMCCSLLSYGQFIMVPSSSVDSTTTNQKQSLQYVKIEIGMHILDCPVLPAQLKEKLMTLKGIKDYTVDQKNSSILFNIPEGVVTKEGIEAIAARCGFPPQSANVLMDSKPFVF